MNTITSKMTSNQRLRLLEKILGDKWVWLTGILVDSDSSSLKMQVDGIFCSVEIHKSQKPLENFMIDEEVQVIAKIKSHSMSNAFETMVFFKEGEVVC